MSTCNGLTDIGAGLIRKIHKYTMHLDNTKILIGGMADNIEEWGAVESMMEEFQLGDKRPATVTALLEMLGYRTIYVLPDDTYEFGQPFQSDTKFDIAIGMYGLAGKVADQKQFFKNFHDLVDVGGLIVHSGVWANGKDNRFYSHNPMFWARLAQHNEYGVQAHFLSHGNGLERLEHPRAEGTGLELVGKYQIRNIERPAYIYTLYTKNVNDEFEFDL